MPYLESLGVPGRYEGREVIDTPEQAFAEYEFTAQSSKTGRTIHELLFGRLVAEDGKIKLLREAVNLVEIAL